MVNKGLSIRITNERLGMEWLDSRRKLYRLVRYEELSRNTFQKKWTEGPIG